MTWAEGGRSGQPRRLGSSRNLSLEKPDWSRLVIPASPILTPTPAQSPVQFIPLDYFASADMLTRVMWKSFLPLPKTGYLFL
jgi:hypothetical protein